MERKALAVWNFAFFLNSFLLGIGLAADAFTVSLANGLSEPKMRARRAAAIAAVFAFFQALMPLLGRLFVSSLASVFVAFEKAIPWVSLILLVFIGAKMIIEALRKKEDDSQSAGATLGALLVQGIATSIDALSVGFTIAEYSAPMALAAAAIIAAVTFAICLGGVYIGKKFGTRLSGAAAILGGSVLIFIGVEIFVTGMFF